MSSCEQPQLFFSNSLIFLLSIFIQHLLSPLLCNIIMQKSSIKQVEQLITGSLNIFSHWCTADVSFFFFFSFGFSSNLYTFLSWSGIWFHNMWKHLKVSLENACVYKAFIGYVAHLAGKQSLSRYCWRNLTEISSLPQQERLQTF